MTLLLIILPLLALQALGFAPPPIQNTFIVPRIIGLSESATENDSPDFQDPFASFIPGQETIATMETIMGSGEETSKDGDIINVQYAGRLLANGKQFDAGTISFKLGDGKVIPGWELGLKGMKVGGKRSIKIPPSLAYGNMGAGGLIPPNSDLEFDCELLGISNGPVAEIATKLGLGNNKKTKLLGGWFALFVFVDAVLPRLGVFGGSGGGGGDGGFPM